MNPSGVSSTCNGLPTRNTQSIGEGFWYFARCGSWIFFIQSSHQGSLPALCYGWFCSSLNAENVSVYFSKLVPKVTLLFYFQGSYQCRCHDGFTGNGVSCRDINECLTNNGGCDQNARCINTEGSFQCVCDIGFKGNGFQCADIDECSNDPSLCENGLCLNHPGSFRCECEMGFMGIDEDKACVDINECDMFNNLCVYGRCENVFGMFQCECDDGYKLDGSGGNCTDIDECENPQSCLYGQCVNTQGDYKCECPTNYDLVAEGNACVGKFILYIFVVKNIKP